jgi:HEAT repeat protein
MNWTLACGACVVVSAGAVVQATGQSQAPAQQLLEQFKSEGNFSRQFQVATKLVALNDPAVLPQLTAWLDHADRHARGNAAFVFAGLGHERGFEVLNAILTDKSERVKGPGIAIAPGNGIVSLSAQIQADRYYAVHLFGSLKDPRALPTLIPLIADESVNYKVAWALGQLGGRAAVDALIAALTNKAPNVRVIAIQALESLGAREALPRLREMLSDNEKSSFGSRVSVADAARAAIATLQKTPRPISISR